jgi:NAD-dependent DNA ligase
MKEILQEAIKYATQFTNESELPIQCKNGRIDELLTKKNKNKRESAFVKKISSWKETINTLLTKFDKEKSWRFIRVEPLKQPESLKSAAYHPDFIDFTDYMILRRDTENCGDDELCNLSLMHTEFQKQIEEFSVKQPAKVDDIAFIYDKIQIDPLSIFYKKRVAITGTLAQLERAKAEEILMRIGAIVAKSVGKTTDFLVVGYEDSYKFKGSHSNKETAALDLIAKGEKIKIMDEDEFYQQIALSVDAF